MILALKLTMLPRFTRIHSSIHLMDDYKISREGIILFVAMYLYLSIYLSICYTREGSNSKYSHTKALNKRSKLRIVGGSRQSALSCIKRDFREVKTFFITYLESMPLVWKGVWDQMQNVDTTIFERKMVVAHGRSIECKPCSCCRKHG